jgi:hypothetical protein
MYCVPWSSSHPDWMTISDQLWFPPVGLPFIPMVHRPCEEDTNILPPKVIVLKCDLQSTSRLFEEEATQLNCRILCSDKTKQNYLQSHLNDLLLTCAKIHNLWMLETRFLWHVPNNVAFDLRWWTKVCAKSNAHVVKDGMQKNNIINCHNILCITNLLRSFK